MPMQIVSEAVNLAIHAMLVLSANPKRRISTVMIAEHLRVSSSHLAKVMQRLAIAGLVSSMRGTTGGFVLACDPQKVSIAQIVDVIDQGKFTSSCLLKMPRCKEGHCPVSDLHKNLHSIMRERFEQVHLSDFHKNMETFVLPPENKIR